MFPTIGKRKTGIQLRRLMDERALSVKDVQELLGLGSVQSVYHWLNGKSMPTIDKRNMMNGLGSVTIRTANFN